MSSSTNAQAFTFDTEFDESGAILQSSQTFKKYRQDEVDQLCEAARLAGIQSEEAEAARRVAAATEAILNSLLPVLPFAQKLADTMRQEAIQLSMEASKKLAGAALKEFPEEAVIQSLNTVVDYLPSGQKLVLTVSTEVSEQVGDQVQKLLPQGTELILEQDDTARPGTWRLDWNAGGFTHDTAEFETKIDEIIAAHLDREIDEQGDLFAMLA